MSDESYNSQPVTPTPIRSYIIFNVSELNKVDFSLVGESSVDTVRRSVDGTKTFVKWEGSAPSFVSDLETKEGPYNHEEIIAILNGPSWKPEINY